MKKLIWSLLTIASLGLSACNNSKTANKETVTEDKKGTETKDKESGKGGFTIEAPAGWDKSDTSVMGQQVVFIRSPRDGDGDDFMENVNVITEKVGEIGIDEYYEKNITYMKNGLTGFERKQENTTTINGVDFKILNYGHVYVGVPIDARVYFTINNGTAYVMTCSAKGGEMGTWGGKFDEVVSTFKLN